jgi:hypothetical protein
MVLTIEPVLQIEAPRNHSPETQERLRQLLDNGAPARPDPKRPGFFEIEDETQVFYIHIVKTTGKVTLLAIWNREAEHIANEAASPA